MSLADSLSRKRITSRPLLHEVQGRSCSTSPYRVSCSLRLSLHLPVIISVRSVCRFVRSIVYCLTDRPSHGPGPLVLVAVLYEIIGVAVAWTVKQLFWVPHRFRYGILVAGGWGNVGDIRGHSAKFISLPYSRLGITATSVIMSITGAAPFNSEKDQTLAVAYISAFILVFMVSKVKLR